MEKAYPAQKAGADYWGRVLLTQRQGRVPVAINCDIGS